jgi:hypothetical protein
MNKESQRLHELTEEEQNNLREALNYAMWVKNEYFKNHSTFYTINQITDFNDLIDKWEELSRKLRSGKLSIAYSREQQP